MKENTVNQKLKQCRGGKEKRWKMTSNEREFVPAYGGRAG